MKKDYFFEIDEKQEIDKVFVLIIYDIEDNKKRLNLSKKLLGYGFRVQKSAFEATITHKKYEKLLNEISKFPGENDSIRIYKIIGRGQVTCFGKEDENNNEDVVIL